MTVNILTGILVAVTGYYAWQTFRMVEEMRSARSTQVLPKIAVSIKSFAPRKAFLRLVSVGPGPALQVEADLSLEPGGAVRHLSFPLLVPGEAFDFHPDPSVELHDRFDLDRITEKYTNVRLSGSCRDSLGALHSIEESLNIREFWTFLEQSFQLVDHDWGKETVDQLKAIRNGLSAIASSIEKAG